MVGPSLTREERRSASRRLQVGFALLVGLSGGLVALQVDPSLPELVGAVLAGLVVGAVLVRYLVRLTAGVGPENPR